MLSKFPKVIFVSVRNPGEEEYLDAALDAIDTIEDDGPTRVATYELVEVNKLSKRVVSSKAKNNASY